MAREDTKDLLSVAKETQISACAVNVFDIIRHNE